MAVEYHPIHTGYQSPRAGHERSERQIWGLPRDREGLRVLVSDSYPWQIERLLVSTMTGWARMQRVANEFFELVRDIAEVEEVRVSRYPDGFAVRTVVDVVEHSKADSIFESELQMIESHPETPLFFRLIERRGCPLAELVGIDPSEVVIRR